MFLDRCFLSRYCSIYIEVERGSFFGVDRVCGCNSNTKWKYEVEVKCWKSLKETGVVYVEGLGLENFSEENIFLLV